MELLDLYDKATYALHAIEASADLIDQEVTRLDEYAAHTEHSEMVGSFAAITHHCGTEVARRNIEDVLSCLEMIYGAAKIKLQCAMHPNVCRADEQGEHVLLYDADFSMLLDDQSLETANAGCRNIQKGSLLHIKNYDGAWEDGDLLVIKVDGTDLICGYARRTDEYVLVQFINPNFPPRKLTQDDLWTIVGKVVGSSTPATCF